MNTAPKSSPVLDHLWELHRKYAGLREGQVVTYIPELAKADPDWFGICLVTADGFVYEVGDSRREFTIQSISKPFVYGMALEDHGRADVLKKVGVEPSGDAFNAVSLDPVTGRPRNPMINAGAITTASLVAGKSHETRLDRILQTFSQCAGREVSVDPAVDRSESETGHRNRAIGHLLQNFDILTEDPDPVVDLYFKQCAISVNCRDLATLANHGMNPKWCENQILERHEPVRSLDAPVAFAEYQLFHGLTQEELAVIEGLLERRIYPKGAVIVNIGEVASELFIVARGSVSVNITLASGHQRRLATLTAGMTFGELAVIDGARRSATVIADSDVECEALKGDDYKQLVDSHPRIKITILENISLAICSRLRKANRELSVLDRWSADAATLG